MRWHDKFTFIIFALVMLQETVRLGSKFARAAADLTVAKQTLDPVELNSILKYMNPLSFSDIIFPLFIVAFYAGFCVVEASRIGLFVPTAERRFFPDVIYITAPALLSALGFAGGYFVPNMMFIVLVAGILIILAFAIPALITTLDKLD